MADWEEHLEDALTYLNESTFYQDHRKLEGDAMMILNSCPAPTSPTKTSTSSTR